jgi:hypothetical protein
MQIRLGLLTFVHSKNSEPFDSESSALALNTLIGSFFGQEQVEWLQNSCGLRLSAPVSFLNY